MDKEEKENKEMPEDPVDETTGEEKIQDKAEDAGKINKEEPEKKESKDNEDKDAETKKEEAAQKIKTEEKKPTEEKQDTSTKEEEKGPTEESKPKETKKQDIPKTKKPDEKDKKAKHGDDFKYIVRLSNTDIDGEKNVIFGLTSIKGIGMAMATLIIKETKIDQKTKMGNLKDSQIKTLQDAIDSIVGTAPKWMLNHRKDYETGKDIHLIGPEIDLRLRDEINIMKKIRSYRGIRHERGLPCRGQRTRANNRKGLSLGVSKKRQ